MVDLLDMEVRRGGQVPECIMEWVNTSGYEEQYDSSDVTSLQSHVQHLDLYVVTQCGI